MAALGGRGAGRRTALVLAVLALATPARAQVTNEPVAPHADPSKFARGLYGEAEVGTLMFLGEARSEIGPGAAIGARAGYDLLRWVAVQIHAFGSTHTTRFADSPQGGQLLQLYQGTAEGKLSVRFGQVGVAATGGFGVARLSTNLLGTTGLTAPDVQTTTLTLGGLGADYHTLSRHFSFGLGATFAHYQKLHTTGALAATLSARYTF
jgi:hypothetical protein